MIPLATLIASGQGSTYVRRLNDLEKKIVRINKVSAGYIKVDSIEILKEQARAGEAEIWESLGEQFLSLGSKSLVSWSGLRRGEGRVSTTVFPTALAYRVHGQDTTRTSSRRQILEVINELPAEFEGYLFHDGSDWDFQITSGASSGLEQVRFDVINVLARGQDRGQDYTIYTASSAGSCMALLGKQSPGGERLVPFAGFAELVAFLNRVGPDLLSSQIYDLQLQARRHIKSLFMAEQRAAYGLAAPVTSIINKGPNLFSHCALDATIAFYTGLIGKKNFVKREQKLRMEFADCENCYS